MCVLAQLPDVAREPDQDGHGEDEHGHDLGEEGEAGDEGGPVQQVSEVHSDVEIRVEEGAEGFGAQRQVHYEANEREEQALERENYFKPIKKYFLFIHKDICHYLSFL